MAAIYKREMHSYLTSAVGYVFLAVFFAISGYYFLPPLWSAILPT